MCVNTKKEQKSTKCIYKLKNATKEQNLQNLSLIKSFFTTKMM